jgi:alpha-1,3-rhamnosyltransferase
MIKYQPLVTIVVPCYNHERYIGNCIDSIIKQDYENIELIILDDGSSDKSFDIINGYIARCNERFKRFEFVARENKGLSSTLNESLDWARGEFFSPIASDDEMLPHKISHQVSEMISNPTVSACFGGVDFVDDSSNVQGSKNRSRKIYCFEDVIMRRANLMAPTAMMRTEHVKDVGGYKAGIVTEDFYMWLLLSRKKGSMLHCGTILSKYRVHDSNISKKKDIIWKSVEQCIMEHKDHPLFNRAYAYSLFIYAYDLQKLKDSRSRTFFKKALAIDKRFLFSIKFLRYGIRTLFGLRVGRV